MKMRKLIGLILFLSAIAPAMAQQDTVFRFDDMMENIDLKSVDMSLVPSNYFGEDIGLKFYVLAQSYTYVVPGTPSSPGDKTEIEKPVIYNNVKKMNRYYKKKVKKGEMTKEEAKKKLHHVLNVGLSIKNQATGPFEDALRKKKSADEVAALFDAVELITY